jgi:hypothetical protein
MIESTDGDFIPLALLQTSIDSTKRIFLERIHTRTSNKRTADDSRKRQMEFVDIASLHAHVHTLFPRQEQPIQTLAMFIALTGCDFCNSLPTIGLTNLWAARHLFRNVDVSAEGGALAAISHTYTQNFAMHIVVGKEADITDSVASPEHAARVYETTASHIQRSAKLSAQTRDRIWTATHMCNHVRNAMWTVTSTGRVSNSTRTRRSRSTGTTRTASKWEEYKGTRYSHGDSALVVELWLHWVADDTSGLTFQEWDPSTGTDDTSAPVAMLVNSSELRAADFPLAEVRPLHLDTVVRGGRRTRGAAVRKLQGVRKSTFVLSVENDNDFRSRYE